MSSKAKKEKEEWEEFLHFIEKLDLRLPEGESEGDFEGVSTRDLDIKFKKGPGVKSTQSDPIMKGKIMARTSGIRTKFCADTGCEYHAIQTDP